MKIVLYIAVMAGVTYLIRMLPFLIFKEKITNRFVRSFLHYIPYAVLAAMTFPAILFATVSPISAVVGLLVALGASFLEWGLLPTALLACLGVWIAEFFC